MGVVTRRDSPYYWLNLERPGLRPLREATKIPVAAATPQQAKENRRLADQVYAIRMGQLAKQHHGIRDATTRTTFREYASWYLKHRTSQKATAARERSAVSHLLAALGRVPLDQIDRHVVQEYLSHRTKHVTASTANREVDVLKDMLAWAVPKYLVANPLTGMRRLRTQKRGIRILTFDEERRLLAAARRGEAGLPADEGAALIMTAVDTFMRLGDLIALTPDQYHGSYIHVEDPKIAPYDVAVSRRARRALDALGRKAPRARWVFQSLHAGRGARAAENRAIRFFAALCDQAGVPHGRAVRGVTFHSLRHTGATRFMKRGGSLRDLMEQGGWRDIESVLRYAHPSDELVEQVSSMSRARPVHAGRRESRIEAQNRGVSRRRA
ncbi:MAG: tyrosine-type recombinase/integrase [Vicinamibacterales bacterium]